MRLRTRRRLCRLRRLRSPCNTHPVCVELLQLDLGANFFQAPFESLATAKPNLQGLGIGIELDAIARRQSGQCRSRRQMDRTGALVVRLAECGCIGEAPAAAAIACLKNTELPLGSSDATRRGDAGGSRPTIKTSKSGSDRRPARAGLESADAKPATTLRRVSLRVGDAGAIALPTRPSHG
jgi:hypothetical protein